MTSPPTRSARSTSTPSRPAEAGGLYEYAPGIRTPEDETYDAVARALDMEACALVVFRGRYAPHRVTAVEGAHPG